MTTESVLPHPRRSDGCQLSTQRRLAQLKLGEVMIELGLIDPAGRDKALARQGRLGLPFGECCVRMKLVSARGLAQALFLQFGQFQPIVEDGPIAPELVMLHSPTSRYAEALRAVSHRVLRQWLSADPQWPVERRYQLAVTGAEQGAGRSQVAANLAISFAQAGRRALLIDADLRSPAQHRYFDLPQHPGLSRLLSCFAASDVVRQVGSVPNLSVITAGPLPPNPLHLLGSGNLEALLAQARDHYDVVVVDTPAGSGYADAQIIAAAVGSAIVVAHRNRARRARLHRFVRALRKSEAHIIGTILNA